MTEEQLREYVVPWIQTEKELIEFIRVLAERKQTYGTCVYAMSLASVATFRYISHVVGSTGFQSESAHLDMI